MLPLVIQATGDRQDVTKFETNMDFIAISYFKDKPDSIGLPRNTLDHLNKTLNFLFHCIPCFVSELEAGD